MNFPVYFLSGLLVYLSGIAGLILYRAANDELKAYHIQLKLLLSIIFTAIIGLFSYSAFPDNPEIFFLMMFSSALVAFSSRIWKDIFFVFLSAIFALAYIFSNNFIIIATLIFAFGMISFGMNMSKRSFKRIMIRRLPFVILVLFGYLLTFAL